MPNKRKRTTEKCSWSDEQMKLAIKAVQEGRYGLRSAARHFELPLTTLQNRVKKGFYKAKMGTHTIFSIEQEEDICQHLLLLSKMFYGLTPLQLRRAVYSYANKLSIYHRFNKEKEEAGKDWMYGFMSRHPQLSFRKPEATSINRIIGFNKTEVDRFFENLTGLIAKYNFGPTRIFNVDETGITTVNRPNRIIGSKGQKQIGSATSGERGKNITICCCFSASGSYTLPLFIFPRIRMTPALERGGPPGSLYKCTKSGWMTEEMFLTWLHHFADIHKPTKTDPVLLVLDNHSSHISLAIYDYCRDNGIVMISIPPHTSHRIQPLDLTFFSALKKAYDVECDLFLKMKPFEKITIFDISGLFTKAYTRTANAEKAISGFAKSGIFPVNPNVFSEDDFYKPVKETPILREVAQNIRADQDICEQDAIPGCSKAAVESQNQNRSFATVVPTPAVQRSSTKPKTTRVVKKQRSEILTSTPMKTELQEKEKKRKEKLEKILEKEKKETGKGLLNKKRAKKSVVRQVFESSSEDENIENLCDDDELDDIDNNFDEIYQNEGESCLICGEYGKNEIWFRCVACGGWSHKLCSGADVPDNYICDICTYK